MSSVNGLGLPVCPVDVLLKQSHRKDVGDVLHQNYTDTSTKTNKLQTTPPPPATSGHERFTCVSVGSIQAGECDVVLPGVGPVDAVVDKVQRQAVGPRDLILHDDTPVGAVHADPADVWAVSPVRPVQEPVGGVPC